MKVALYQWDGKTFSDAGTLTNNKGAISALAFSPDGTKLAAGDVRGFPSSAMKCRADVLFCSRAARSCFMT
jgi:WD40 repeat protein